MQPFVKLAIAVLLILCLADMPYSFYQLVRFCAAGAFAYLSYDYFRSNRNALGVLFAALALLFQPFFKIALSRMVWNTIDVLVAIGLIYLIISTFGKKPKRKRK